MIPKRKDVNSQNDHFKDMRSISPIEIHKLSREVAAPHMSNSSTYRRLSNLNDNLIKGVKKAEMKKKASRFGLRNRLKDEATPIEPSLIETSFSGTLGLESLGTARNSPS
jgi:hypothetical protein